MKILAITSSYPKFEGDSTAPFVELLTRQVANLGHEIHMVVPEHREWSRPPVEGGIHYRVVRYSPRPGWTPWGYSEALQQGDRIRPVLYTFAPIVYASTLRACLALRSAVDFDVVHAHWVVPNGLIAARASRRMGLPLVVSLHGSDVAIAERSRWIGPVARRALAGAAAVTGASRSTLERARVLGVPADALELVPYGVDSDRFKPDLATATELRTRLKLGDDHVMVLGVGRLVTVKGFAYAIAAMASLQRSAPDVRLVLVGDGGLRSELELQARRLGLENRVVLVGDVRRDEMPAYFAAADIVVVPSIRHPAGFVEALGNVALEAMASGRPVIASRVGGLPEVVRDGETGILVEDQQADALAQAVLALARDRDRRHELGRNARRSAEESLSWRAAAERLVDVYERAIRRA